jgi:hypothetical protein
MRYMLTIYNNAEASAAIEGEALEEFRRAHGELQSELIASGELVDTSHLIEARFTPIEVRPLVHTN